MEYPIEKEKQIKFIMTIDIRRLGLNAGVELMDCVKYVITSAIESQANNSFMTLFTYKYQIVHIIKVLKGDDTTHYDVDNLVFVCEQCHKAIEGMDRDRLIEYLEEGKRQGGICFFQDLP